MSKVIVRAHQVGISNTPTNNFTLQTPAVPDGTMKIARGLPDATTQDILKVSTDGIVTFPQGIGGMEANKAGAGWQKLPSGLIVQWGSIGTSTGGSTYVTFPVVFPTALLGLTLGTDTSGQFFLTYRSTSPTGFLSQGWQSSTGAAQSGVAGTYIAIGY